MRKNKKNLLNVVVKNKEGIFQNKDKQKDYLNKNEKDIFIKKKEINESLEVNEDNKKKNKDNIEIGRLFSKYEINEQLELLKNICSKMPSKIKYLLYCLLTGFSIGFLEYLMTFIFGFNNFQTYFYSIYSLLICIFMLIMCSFNYKIIIIAMFVFGLTKYIFYNVGELSKIYSQNIIFDIYTFNITILLVVLIFFIEYFVAIIYLFIWAGVNYTVIVFHFTLESSKSKMYLTLLGFVISNYYIVIFITKYFSDMAVIKYIFLVILNSIVLFLIMISSYYKSTKNIKLSFDMIRVNMYKGAAITYPIYKRLKNINYSISKMHDNLNFLNGISFFKIGNFKGFIYISIIYIWGYSIYGLYHYFGSYQYHQSFFEKNNGYCYNIEEDAPILKNNNNNENVLVIKKEKIENGYIYKRGLFNNNYTRIEKDFNKRRKENESFYEKRFESLINNITEKSEYYIYEKKCKRILE